ncbi:unnamed protein product [Brugia pahangi]|uniref:Protein FAR1-RELATED SEQUENCE n=1 Tax=Brugia pahangi TaxID=6280 RepID=A0A0N4TI07_BRUPA|nr:unnamed protein product [Brugia pahangi]
MVGLSYGWNGKKEYDGNLYDIMVRNSHGGDGEQVTVEMVKTCSNENCFYVVVLFQIDDHCVARLMLFNHTLTGLKHSIFVSEEKVYRDRFMLGKIDPYLLPERSGYFSFINIFQTEVREFANIMFFFDTNHLACLILCSTYEFHRIYRAE